MAARSHSVLTEVLRQNLETRHHRLENANDQRRDAWLQSQGFGVLRFWNNDVLGNTDGVLELIMKALDQRPSPGALRAPPSPRRGEGKERDPA